MSRFWRFRLSIISWYFFTPGFHPCWIIPRSYIHMHTNMKRFRYCKKYTWNAYLMAHFNYDRPTLLRQHQNPVQKHAIQSSGHGLFTEIVRIDHNHHLLETKNSHTIYTYKTLKICSGSIIHQHSVEKKPRIKWKIKSQKKKPWCQSSCKLIATYIILWALHSSFTRYLFSENWTLL